MRTALGIGALTLGLLVALEGLAALRYTPTYFPQPVEDGTFRLDPWLGHALRADSQTPYRINRLGFRGEEFPVQKPDGERRVVLLGDSITFGWELLSEQEPYPAVLQSFLPDSTRVINAGVPSYTSLQVLRHLERDVWPLDPDVLAVLVGWNDIAFALRADWAPGLELRAWIPRVNPALWQFAVALTHPGQSQRRSTPLPAVALYAYRQHLERIVAEAGERHVPLILVGLPTVLSQAGNAPSEVAKAAPYRVADVQAADAIWAEVCAAHPAVTCPDILGLGEQGKAAYFTDWCHLTTAGARIMGARLAAIVAPLLDDMD